MRIGLLGFGVVGRGVYDITSKRDDLQVVKVLCLEDVQLPDAQVTRDFQEILNVIFGFDFLKIFSSSLNPSKVKVFPLKQFKKSQIEDL